MKIAIVKKVILGIMTFVNFSAEGMIHQKLDNITQSTGESDAIQDIKVAKQMMNLSNDSVLTLEGIPHGVANEVFYIKVSDSVLGILKKYHGGNLNLISDISTFTNKLRLWNIPVPFVLQIHQDGEFIYSLQECAAGKSRVVSDGEKTEIAKLMSKIHQLPICCTFNQSLLSISKFQELFKLTSVSVYFKPVKEIFDSIDTSYMNLIPTGIIHGDFSYSNLLFEGNKISSILDFDNVRTSYLLTDITRCQIFFGENEQKTISKDKVEAFARAYHSFRKMTREELLNFYQHMKLMLAYAVLDSYYHVSILTDRPPLRFESSPFNGDSTDVLFNKLMSIKHLSFIDVSSNHIWSKLNFYQNPPILFLGASGVGKTTLMHAVVSKFNDKY